MYKVNFHSHTLYSNHGSNKPRELIEQAIECGFKVFGISEHIPLDGLWPHGGTTEEDVMKLRAEVLSLAEEYKDKITIYMGLESEYHPAFEDKVKKWYQTPGIQYMLFGNHIYDVKDGKCVYLDSEQTDLIDKQIQYLEQAGESGMFTYYCHPDLFLKAYKKWDDHAKRLADAYINASIKYGMPLEINVNGLHEKKENGNWYQYPSGVFWDYVSNSEAKVIIGIDTHDPFLLDNPQYLESANNFIREHNLEKNLANTLRLKNEIVCFDDRLPKIICNNPDFSINKFQEAIKQIYSAEVIDYERKTESKDSGLDLSQNKQFENLVNNIDQNPNNNDIAQLRMFEYYHYFLQPFFPITWNDADKSINSIYKIMLWAFNEEKMNLEEIHLVEYQITEEDRQEIFWGSHAKELKFIPFNTQDISEQQLKGIRLLFRYLSICLINNFRNDFYNSINEYQEFVNNLSLEDLKKHIEVNNIILPISSVLNPTNGTKFQYDTLIIFKSFLNKIGIKNLPWSK